MIVVTQKIFCQRKILQDIQNLNVHGDMPWIDNFIEIIFIQDFILDLIGIVREGLYL